MRCCVDIAKFLLFLFNLLAFILFVGLDSVAVTYLVTHLLDGSVDVENVDKSAILLTLMIICIVLCSFLVIFTCLGCCGAACKSSCMVGAFIVIEFVLLGATVGGIVFLHSQYDDPVQDILTEEMSRSVALYTEHLEIKSFWDFYLNFTACCAIQDKNFGVWKRASLEDGFKVPRACCTFEPSGGYVDCMYEPNYENTHSNDCVDVAVPFVQAALYGLPVIMLVSLVLAFLVVSSNKTNVNRTDVTRRTPYHSRSQYSIGADDEFQHTRHGGDTVPNCNPTAPYENEPYNPDYELNNMRNIESYPVGPVPPPQQEYNPLLHNPPPSYQEVFKYPRDHGMSYKHQ